MECGLYICRDVLKIVSIIIAAIMFDGYILTGNCVQSLVGLDYWTYLFQAVYFVAIALLSKVVKLIAV